MSYRTCGIWLKIFQAAEVILVNDIKNIICKQVNIKQQFIVLIRETRTYSGIDQSIPWSWCFCIVCQVNTILGP